MLAVFLAGCSVPPHPADPSLPSLAVRLPHFAAPEFRLHVVGINGAQIPDTALTHSAATLSKHLGRPVRIIQHPPITYPPEALANDPATFPVYDNGRALTDADLRALGSRPYLLHTPDHGLLGVVGAPQPDGYVFPLPYVEPAVALVVVAPGTPAGVTGLTTGVAVAPEGARQPAMIFLRDAAIARQSNVFVPRAKLYQWTLTHELGHVLGVPASNTHKWPVPGLGPHCTHPECVMYTGLDWRVVASGLLQGWPLDFCPECAAELKAARQSAAHPGDPR